MSGFTVLVDICSYTKFLRHTCPKYWDANCADLGQTAPIEQFDQGLHILPFDMNL